MGAVSHDGHVTTVDGLPAPVEDVGGERTAVLAHYDAQFRVSHDAAHAQSLAHDADTAVRDVLEIGPLGQAFHAIFEAIHSHDSAAYDSRNRECAGQGGIGNADPHASAPGADQDRDSGAYRVLRRNAVPNHLAGYPGTLTRDQVD